jgi:hypothetical protein
MFVKLLLEIYHFHGFIEVIFYQVMIIIFMYISEGHEDDVDIFSSSINIDLFI